MVVEPRFSFHDKVVIVAAFSEIDKSSPFRYIMVLDQANQHAVFGELSPPELGEVTAMLKLDIEGNANAYHLKTFRDLDRSRLSRRLIEYHDCGLPLASRLKTKFSCSLVVEIAVECFDSTNWHPYPSLEIIGRDGITSDLADESSLQLLMNSIMTYENHARHLDRKADLARPRMVLLISEESRFKKLRAKAGKQLGPN